MKLINEIGLPFRAAGRVTNPVDYTLLRAASFDLISDVAFAKLQKEGVLYENLKDSAQTVVCDVADRIFRPKNLRKWFLCDQQAKPASYVYGCALKGAISELRRLGVECKRARLTDSLTADPDTRDADGEPQPECDPPSPLETAERTLVRKAEEAERQEYARNCTATLTPVFTAEEIKLMSGEMSPRKYYDAGYAKTLQTAYSHRRRCIQRARKLLEG